MLRLAVSLLCVALSAGTVTDEWREDLATLAKTLPEKHKNAYFSISEAEFLGRVAAIEERLPYLSETRVIAEMLQLVASIGDGHTRLFVPIKRMLPIQAGWYRDGIFVIAAREQDREILGGRVEAIGGVPVAQALQRMQLLVAHDNESQLKTGTLEFLLAPDFLHAMDVIPDAQSVTLTLRLRSDKVARVRLESVSSNEPLRWVTAFEGKTPLAFANTAKPYWVETINEGEAAYIQYNSCRQDPAYPMAEFREHVRGILASPELESVIVDLRHNGGGDSRVFQPIIETIQASRFNIPGKLFVVIGPRTFSSAVLNAIRFRNETYAAFYGEPTGGRPNHYGEVRTFHLPNSKLMVGYSTKYFRVMRDDPPSLMPDVHVEPAFADYMAGTDPVLDAILRAR